MNSADEDPRTIRAADFISEGLAIVRRRPMKVVNVQTLTEICEAALDGEPVFIIRAQDKAALATVNAYIVATSSLGGKNQIRCERHFARMKEWQEKNPGRLKAAD